MVFIALLPPPGETAALGEAAGCEVEAAVGCDVGVALFVATSLVELCSHPASVNSIRKSARQIIRFMNFYHRAGASLLLIRRAGPNDLGSDRRDV